MEPICYLTWCLLQINEALWHSPGSNFTARAQATEVEKYNLKSPMGSLEIGENPLKSPFIKKAWRKNTVEQMPHM